jgi:glycosyltransferase involved in cell wall biosynthesis
VLPSQERVRRFAEELQTSENTVCVWNCAEREEASLSPSRNGDNQLILFYHGSIVPSQLPATIVDALAQLPSSVRLRVVGYETAGHEGYVRQLEEHATRLGVRQRLEFLGSQPERSELLALCRECDVGLALFTKPTSQPMVGASNKPFDYLACRLALLVPDLADWIEMYVEPGYGLDCDPCNPASIGQAVSWLLDHPKEREAMAERGRRRIAAEWNYETQFQPVFELLTGGNAALSDR